MRPSALSMLSCCQHMPDSQHCSVDCTAQPAVSSLAILPGPLVPNCNACVRQHSPCLTPEAPPAIPAEHTSCFTCCYLCSNTSQPGAEGFVMPGCGSSGTCNKCRNFDAARSSSVGARNAQVLLTVTNQSHHAELLHMQSSLLCLGRRGAMAARGPSLVTRAAVDCLFWCKCPGVPNFVDNKNTEVADAVSTTEL
jgi:hypothetical protein